MSDSFTRGVIAEEIEEISKSSERLYDAWEALHISYARAHAFQGPRGAQRDMNEIARRAVEIARSNPCVVHADLVSAPGGSVSFKGWAEAFAISLEYAAQERGRIVRIVRHHLRLDPRSAKLTRDGSSVIFSGHAGERVLTRTQGVRRSALRNVAKGFVSHGAGLTALGLRHWAHFPVEPGGDAPKAVVLMPEGILIGRVGTISDSVQNVTHTSADKRDYNFRRLTNRFVDHAGGPADNRRASLCFFGKTFIGDRTLQPTTKFEGVSMMRECVDRHPVFDLLGSAFLFPCSPILEQRLKERRDEVEAAYRDVASLYEHAAVQRLFSMDAPPPPAPPILWDEPEAVMEWSARGQRDQEISKVRRWGRGGQDISIEPASPFPKSGGSHYPFPSGSPPSWEPAQELEDALAGAIRPR